MARDDFYASAFGRVYSAYMERPRLAHLVSRVVWGGDPRPYYESMERIAEVPRGGTIVDCPCGAGPAFRALSPESDARYIAADASPSMLDRARRSAATRDLDSIEFLEADATDLPLPSDSADLFLSLWGLHCFDDPAAAIREAARILEPSGRLVGCCFLSGEDTRRQRLLVRPGTGGFGSTIGTQAEVEAWLRDAGLGTVSQSRSGPFLFFEAEAPTGIEPV